MCFVRAAAGGGQTATDAIAPMIAKAYPKFDTGANEKMPDIKGRTKLKKSNGNSSLSRRHVIKGAGALAAGIAAPSILSIRSAYAAYPDRPVKIVVANTPGGPSDIVGRITAAALEQATGKTFIIENRGGAGSNIGMGYVARSDPDGYTILLATNAYSVNATLYSQIPYDPYKDFVGVSELATSPNTFVVKSDLPAKTMKEFVELARANPDKFNCSTPPIGTTPQIQLEVLKLRENLPKLEDVVYKGGGDALQALLSGTSQLSSGSLPPAAQHIKAGTLRCLAVTGETRWPDMPDVPTMVESGYADFVFATDTVLMAPSKTPPAVVKWLEQETLKVLSTPEMKDKLYKAGFQVRPKGAEAAWARVSKEIGIFKDIIEKSGMKKL
jgi:tripartite-type tricarboxylate transporter receptor subunit TctC